MPSPLHPLLHKEGVGVGLVCGVEEGEARVTGVSRGC